jgi:hypothetical protein
MHKLPSRIKYELSHPTISIQVDLDTDLRLRELRERTGKSLGTLIRENLQVQQRNEQVTHNRGCAQAVEEHQIRYPCARCGKPIPIEPNGESDRMVIDYLSTRRMHASCATRS